MIIGTTDSQAAVNHRATLQTTTVNLEEGNVYASGNPFNSISWAHAYFLRHVFLQIQINASDPTYMGLWEHIFRPRGQRNGPLPHYSPLAASHSTCLSPGLVPVFLWLTFQILGSSHRQTLLLDVSQNVRQSPTQTMGLHIPNNLLHPQASAPPKPLLRSPGFHS